MPTQENPVNAPVLCRFVSSLEKIMPGKAPFLFVSQLRGCRNERFSVQLACYYQESRPSSFMELSLTGGLSEYCRVYDVGLVSAGLPSYGDADESELLFTAPTLVPDVMRPLEKGVRLLPHQWRSFWITIDPAGKLPAGSYSLTACLRDSKGEWNEKAELMLTLEEQLLPKSPLLYTNWFHADCLASYYHKEMLSEEHWKLLESYLSSAAYSGINLILTPIFTPPLDTEVGGERPTMQLVDVTCADGGYRFGYSLFDRWVSLCKKYGIENFEISHLFTQWGAHNAPKIMAHKNGKLTRIFGWETDAHGEEYSRFLRAFLPDFAAHLKKSGLAGHVWFHISDEPSLSHLESYTSAVNLVRECLPDFPIFDALSNVDFYNTGAVKTPVVATNHAQSFYDSGVTGVWLYYCCSQYKKVANRFLSTPPVRNRILGVQLYLAGAPGFLHWGYNFWYSQFSRRLIDPYSNTDADGGFPSGDGFVVYPGPDGIPYSCTRMEVFYDALQDYRLLCLAEQKLGRETVEKLLQRGLPQPITLETCPVEAGWFDQWHAALYELLND